MTWADVVPFPDNPIYERRIQAMRREWGGYRPEIVGSPAIFDNSANAYPDLPEHALIIGDGNHRYVLAQGDGKLDDEFLADLYRGLSRSEMHRRRRGLNDRRKINPVENFLHFAEESKLSQQARIKKMVEGLGWEIAYNPHADGGLSCTNELEWIWAREQGALVRTLQTYERAFGRKGDKHGQSRVIKGLGAFWIRYPDADPDRLAKALGETTPPELYRAGRNQHEVLNFIKTVTDGIRYVIVMEYNRAARKGKLEP